MAKTVPFKRVRAKLMADPEVREAYSEMALEFTIARAVIQARVAANLTQEELAERMGTSQAAIARLESGRFMPTMRTLKRVAKATGTSPRIELVPA